MYDVSREKKVYTIYLYIVIRQIIHNEVFFLIFGEEKKKRNSIERKHTYRLIKMSQTD